MTRLRLIPISLGIVLCCAAAVDAQVVVTPSISAQVRTTPGFIDLDDAAKDLHVGFGLAVGLLTDGWIGVEGESTFTPSAFSGHDLVQSSRLVVASGSLLATAPARWGRVVRPYVSLGAGVVQINSVDVARLFVTDAMQPIATASAGAWWWLGPRVGVRTTIRFVRSLRPVETDSLETWQPSIGLALRF
jgi:hypothetical protein